MKITYDHRKSLRLPFIRESGRPASSRDLSEMTLDVIKNEW
jgi:hypothetical protein